MKVSFITTVLNEENTILSFLHSLDEQTRIPDEVVIVDGYSIDRTVSVIDEFEKNLKRSKKTFPKIRVIKKRGNRSVGRNEAIRNASGNIIVCTDVGCRMDKNWIEKIIKPFENNAVDVVSGFYYPVTGNNFEKALASYTCVMSDKVDPKGFLPSSRSIAFRKDAWEEVGGYPEELDTCEDLVFARELKRRGFHFVFQKSAFVYWPQRKNIIEAARQFYSYAVGDGEARYFRPQTPLLFGRYAVGIILLSMYFLTGSALLLLLLFLFFLFYLLWAIQKNYKYIENSSAYFWLPMLQLVSDVAVISGTLRGFFNVYLK